MVKQIAMIRAMRVTTYVDIGYVIQKKKPVVHMELALIEEKYVMERSTA